MRATIVIGAVSLLASVILRSLEANSAPVTAYSPEFHVMKTVQDGVEIDGAKIDVNISEKSLARILQYVQEQMNINYLYRLLAVPGYGNLFLVEGLSSVESEEEFGPQLYLILDRGDSFSTKSRTMSRSDTNTYTPTIYSGENTALILAEVGNEGSWGLRVFEIEDGVMFNCGDINVAIPGDIWPKSPLPYARVLETETGWEIQFSTELILRSDVWDYQELTPYQNEPILFVVHNCDTRFILGKAKAVTKSYFTEEYRRSVVGEK